MSRGALGRGKEGVGAHPFTGPCGGVALCDQHSSGYGLSRTGRALPRRIVKGRAHAAAARSRSICKAICFCNALMWVTF